MTILDKMKAQSRTLESLSDAELAEELATMEAEATWKTL